MKFCDEDFGKNSSQLYLYSQNNSITDAWQGPKYASGNHQRNFFVIPCTTSNVPIWIIMTLVISKCPRRTTLRNFEKLLKSRHEKKQEMKLFFSETAQSVNILRNT